ncbi:hypothetical protein [Mucilaginibacter sp.]|uniref:hypothetical protein n=1 Tax=Mucilaginibacter sp. TaxID=1882438 RepID=UPI002632818C|nr:hypothetical protein [Mucilaginibacter sp.]MDB4921234.1 hypothetical protein [Mucilaginibacter sp.]
MKVPATQIDTAALYNTAVHQAYGRILKHTKQLLASIEQTELRYALERMERSKKPNTVIHELLTPLLYLRLECSPEATMTIHFGIEHVDKTPLLGVITSSFLRALYKETAQESTAIDIEASVKTDWFIKSCSEMFEYVEERNKYHTFKQIKYKRSPQQKKLLAVA